MRILSCLFLAICLWARPAQAHPTGVSKVDITLKPDSAEARIEVKRDDIIFVTRIGDPAETPRAQWPELSDRIAYYFETRLELRFDHSSQPVHVLSYRKEGDPKLKLDSAGFYDTTIAFRLGWPIPAGAKRLDISSKMFAELELQPLCHLRVYYRGQEIQRRFLGLDDRFSMPLANDSLEALYEAAKRPAPAAGQAPPPAGNAADEESVVGRFLKLGFTHILPEGLDHILFVLGLFFFSTLFRPLLLQVTAFTIAHSITLGLSLLGIFSLPSRLVEPLIALSIAVVALENIFFRKMRPSRLLIVFGFGLVHGLGFAGVLKGLGLPENQFLKVLISFNLGVEGGQLAVIALAAAMTGWMWKKPWYFKRVVVPASALIAAIGLYWFVQRIFWPVG
jgi:hydrogenase/urease accessory protein HupE